MIQYPGNLWLLLIVIPVVAILVSNFQKGKHDLYRIGGEWRKHQLYDVYLVKGFFSSLSFVFFIIFTVLALSGVSGTGRKIIDIPSKADIVFSMDISRSMLSDDILPSRLSRSKDAVKNIMGRLPEERYGLVVFKGRGVKLAPVTEDSEAVLLNLLSVSPEMFTSAGTNLEAGLLAAASMFPKGEERRKVIILFSDGENLSGNPGKAVQFIKDKGIEVVVFGAGTETGKVLRDSSGRIVTDKTGNEVITRLDRSKLKYIASSLGGSYFEMSASGSVSEAVDSLALNISSSRLVTAGEEAYTFYLFLAVLLLILFVSIRIFPWKNVF